MPRLGRGLPSLRPGAPPRSAGLRAPAPRRCQSAKAIRAAASVAAVREETPSLDSTDETWRCTVRSEMNRRREISLSRSPSASSARTSRSRGSARPERSGPLGGACGDRGHPERAILCRRPAASARFVMQHQADSRVPAPAACRAANAQNSPSGAAIAPSRAYRTGEQNETSARRAVIWPAYHFVRVLALWVTTAPIASLPWISMQARRIPGTYSSAADRALINRTVLVQAGHGADGCSVS